MYGRAMPQAEAAETVRLTFHAGTPDQVSIGLASLARRLEQIAPVSRGSSSWIWRFCPLKGREARAGEPHFAFKRSRREPASRRQCRPFEFGYLSRLSASCFPQPVGHGILENGDYCVVTEWIEGRNLARHSLEILTELTENGTYDDFCRDLLAIHERLKAAGIQHSDIWEPNIIVRDGRPVLVDFGWAREFAEEPLIETLHQPDDTLAMNQLLKRLAALHNLLLHDKQVREYGAGRT